MLLKYPEVKYCVLVEFILILREKGACFKCVATVAFLKKDWIFLSNWENAAVSNRDYASVVGDR